MAIFRNVVFIAALAGLCVGVLMTIMQQVATVPLILKAEVYEQSAPAHEHAATATGEVMAHEHEEEGWAPADGLPRLIFTLLANIVTAVGFALLLVVASELAGGITDWRQGIFWGLGAFAAVTLAPGLGLPPELPAMPAADLGARQLWWVTTVALTAAGLALLVFRRSLPLAVLAIVLIVAPHVIGAPQPASFESPIPEGLHHDFVVGVIMTSFLFWVALGGAAGYLRSRVARPAF